jgi:hypothetical protein
MVTAMSHWILDDSFLFMWRVFYTGLLFSFYCFSPLSKNLGHELLCEHLTEFCKEALFTLALTKAFLSVYGYILHCSMRAMFSMWRVKKRVYQKTLHKFHSEVIPWERDDLNAYFQQALQLQRGVRVQKGCEIYKSLPWENVGKCVERRYGGNSMHLWIIMENETYWNPGMGEEGLRRMMEGVNSTMIDCKNSSKRHCEPPVLE